MFDDLQIFDDGSSIEYFSDGSAIVTDINGDTSTPNIPVDVQTFDDGSTITTYADGTMQSSNASEIAYAKPAPVLNTNPGELVKIGQQFYKYGRSIVNGKQVYTGVPLTALQAQALAQKKQQEQKMVLPLAALGAFLLLR